MSSDLSELIALSCADLSTTSSSSQVLVIDAERRLSIKQMTATEFASARAAAAAKIENALLNVAGVSMEQQQGRALEDAAVTSAPQLMSGTEISTKETEFGFDALEETFEDPKSAEANLGRIVSMPNLETQVSQSEFAIAEEQNSFPNTEENTTAPSITMSASPASSVGSGDICALPIKPRLLPLSPAPRDRITSLPNVLEDEKRLLLHASSTAGGSIESATLTSAPASPCKPQLELHSVESLLKGQETAAAGKCLELELKGGCRKRSSTNSSNDDYETTRSSFIADSIELLRMQRRERDRKSLTPSPPERGAGAEAGATEGAEALQMRHDRDHSAAPDRSSMSSVGSVSASKSFNASMNTSRRGSTASGTGEIAFCVSASVIVPKQPGESAFQFPLAKTASAPNIERRKSSLTALFPGPSPLVAPEPVLHTDPIKNDVEEDDDGLTMEQIHNIVEDTVSRAVYTGKSVHRTKTPPPVGVKLGVNLKKVSPPRTQITVKKNEGPMLGVVLRRVEKKVVPQKSILDDDKPLYHLSIVRSDQNDQKPIAKPKPKPAVAPLQKSATTTAVKKNPGGILTGPQATRTVPHHPPPQTSVQKLQRPQPGVPITIQKIEGDKIIIIKKFIVPKNSKIPEQYLKVGACACASAG